MTPRNLRPLVVLATLALSACPFNLKYNVENAPGRAVAAQAEWATLRPGAVTQGSYRADRLSIRPR